MGVDLCSHATARLVTTNVVGQKGSLNPITMDLSLMKWERTCDEVKKGAGEVRIRTFEWFVFAEGQPD